MTEAVIGVVGAYGAVGRAVVEQLRARPRKLRLRLGGRRGEPLRRIVRDECAGDAEARVFDLTDSSALTRFCAGCDIVINCAGPAHQISGTAAGVAVTTGTHYVDPGGDERLLARLGDFASKDRTAILSAGMLPGLSGLLPRRLALEFDRCHRLTVFHGVLDRFTPAAAEDFLVGLDSNESLGAWEHRARASHAMTRLIDIELPLFLSRVTAHPYLSTECERVARLLMLEHGRWYNVFEGDHMLAALDQVAGRALDGPALEDAARHLMRAAELDVAGRTPHQILLFQLDGERSGTPSTRSLMLKSVNAAALTGTMAVLAAEAVLAGHIPPGAHFAAEALDPVSTVQRLRESHTAVRIEHVEGPLPDSAEVEEGAL